MQVKSALINLDLTDLPGIKITAKVIESQKIFTYLSLHISVPNELWFEKQEATI